IFFAGLLYKQTQILLITRDIDVALVLLYRSVVVTKLNQHQIVGLQCAIDFIPTTLFKKGACAAPTFGFVKHNGLLRFNQMTELGEIITVHKWLEFLSPARHWITMSQIIRIKCVICSG